MKKIKKILCIFLVVLMCMTSAPLSGFVGLELPQWNWKASALASSGQCGENVTYTYDDSTKELVISGSGAMTDYGYNSYGFPASPFYDNGMIRSIVIEDGVTSIGYGAFFGCVNLKSVTIPDSVTNIGGTAFSCCYSLANVTIPDSVTSIGEAAFSYCTSFTNITIPDSVTNIDGSAFYDCSSLESITLPDSITSIGYGIFSRCESLESIMIPNSVEIIGESAFSYCTRLTDIVIPGNVAEIECGAFAYCSNLTNIDIPDGLTSIGESAFEYCENLTKITIPDSVTSIGDKAFYNCTSLTNITIPCNVASIGDELFAKCSKLTNTNIANGVTSIGDRMFYDCTSLKNIIIPESVTIIGDYAFAWCESLTSITIPDSVTSIGEGVFECCLGLTSVKIPDMLENIGKRWFEACISLINISISENVTSIESYAFGSCESLISITIPNSVISIESNAFEYCESLTDVYFYGTEEEWNNIYIGENNEPLRNATIHFLGEEEKECDHIPLEQTIPASCTVNGMKFYICLECGETIGEPTIIPAGHTPGEWETVLAPTYEAEGKRIKKCTVCGETVETEILPKLVKKIVEDEKTGVSIEIPADAYDGEVEIEVSESFDGTAFNILDTKTNAVQKKIYDIKMFVDGQESQPNGKITVRIPLPEGYNSGSSFVYYVNTVTGDIEKMNAEYKDGYMIFETDHFSYYAVIVEPDIENCSCNCHASGIKKIFFNIILFFQKIFKKNKECICGINHY